ncbi:MAG: hypothetical protein A2X86_03400 [Bdellovibrionales bacterium GWA2_49_15]|nr:MAG: hypothetical protein A2X86_03400 [Bdellovibrionales bacterium GWA2_49_15]HAZ12261.1 hypothetical protein [Bdellovibrionales bacterium]
MCNYAKLLQYLRLANNREFEKNKLSEFSFEVSIKKKVKTSKKREKDWLERILEVGLVSGFLLGAVLCLLLIPSENGMQVVEADTFLIVLDQTKSFETDIAFHVRKSPDPFVLSGGEKEILALHEKIKVTLIPPLRLTFWMAPPFLGFGKKQVILGIKSEKEVVLNPHTYIARERSKNLVGAFFLFGLSLLFMAAIYFDWQWVWHNAD